MANIDKTCVDITMCGLEISYGGDVAVIECHAIKLAFYFISFIIVAYIQ